MKVVIIGGGFSGAVTAVNLMRMVSGEPLHVVLVNQSGRMARGIAYGTRSAAHVLNVPAGNMSALADDPDDFVRFCRWSDPSVDATSFVSRRLYGTYLEALLAAAEHSESDEVRLERAVEEVVSLRMGDDGGSATVMFADGRCVTADRVVLAFGHFAPCDPPAATPEFCVSSRYIGDPWAPGALDAIRADEPVLLLGSGLTAVDVTLALQPGRSAPTLCLSRRGLTPQAHRPKRGPSHFLDVERLLQDMGHTARDYVRALRRHVRDGDATGADWRDVIASLRPHTKALWQRLPLAERRRFLRHVQAYWDVLRHRCAPAAFERWQALQADGKVQVAAGRILSFCDSAQGVEVTWRPRGSLALATLTTAHVINCTGPGADVRRSRSPLVGDLLGQGLMRPDPLSLGIEVGEDYAIIDAASRPSRVLHYIGALLKARDWEATAVPELRTHAARLARHLLASTARPA